MNYGVNMPDWHQYNTPQTVRGPSSALSSTSSSGQNANGRVYMAGAGSPALDGMNLTNERHRASAKHQTDASYVPARSYPVVPGAVHMSGNMGTCVTPHYGQSVRNPMMDGLSPLGMPPVTDEAHRNAQMGYAPPTSVNQPPGVVNTATAMSSMGSQGSPLGSASPGRAGVTGAQPYAPCKAPCCNPDPGIYHQHWDKFAHYPASYREAIRQPSGYQPMDARLFLTKAHKDCLENKDIIEPVTYPGDHRGPRAFTDYNKYARKESLARNYPSANNGIPHQNYPMQNYQFSGSEYQKCPYTGKEYGRRGANQSGLPSTAVSTKNPNMLKYHEQQSVIVQKYQHSKQMQYQNSPAPNSALVSAPPRSNHNTVSPALQNSYFNPGRDYSQDYSAQDQSVVANRMAQSATGSHVHGSFQKYHVYHQKIAMQRYSLENHLRAFSRMPGYQTHPKYQECVMRYRELLRLQQTVDYQNIVQESPKVPSPTTTVPSGIAPINLQFDQNGVLINSSYIPSSGAYAIPPPAINTNAADINGREAHDDRAVVGSNENFENPARFDREAGLDNGRLGNREPGMKVVDPTRNENAQGYFRNEKKEVGYEQRSRETERTNENQTFVSEVNDGASPVNSTMEYRNSKDFADKPELDVRQFLANWDESEDEESTIATSLEVTEGPREIPTIDANEGSPEKPVTPETLESSSSSPEKETHLESIKIDGTLSLNNIRDITCVRSADDMDDIPTIHIVENLDGGAEIEKIHTVFGNLASAVLEPISICENSSIDDNANGAETIVLFEHQEIGEKSLEFGASAKIDSSEIVEGVMASILESVPTCESEVRTEETRADEERPEVESAPTDTPEEQVATEMSGDDSTSTATTSSASSSSNVKSNDPPETTLRKQSSFTSDESHNPDDISLPDLQTSECTPISTTLNTPIHSDSEESTEHVTDLTISTNPIEIIQNSPIISFTHSPIKIEPYEQLDRSRMIASTTVSAEHPTLDFDFDEEVASNENRKYNETCDSSPESVVEELENEARGHAIYEKRSVETNLTEQAGEKAQYYHDPLVGMAPLTSPRGDKTRHHDVANVACDDTNVTAEQAGDKADYYHDSLVGMAPLTSPRGDKTRHHDVADVVCDDTNVTTEQAGDKVDYYHDPLVGMAPLTSPRGDKSRHHDVANVACDDTNVTTEQADDKVDYYHDQLAGMAPLTSPCGDKTRHRDVANVACDDTNVTTEQADDKVDYYHDQLAGMALLTSPRGDKSRRHDVANVACDDTNVTTGQAGDKVDYYHDPLVGMAPLTSPRGDKMRHHKVANVACDDTNVTTEQAGDKVDYYHDPLVRMVPLTSPRGDKSRHHDDANVACDDTNVTTEQAGDKVDYYHDPLVGMTPLTSPRGNKTRHHDVADVVCDDTNVTTAQAAGEKVDYYHDPLVGMAPLTSPRGDKSRHHDVTNVACDDTNVTTEQAGDKVDYYHDPLVGMAPLTSPRGDKSRHRDVANVTTEQAGDKVDYYHDPLVGMAPLTSPRGDKSRHHDVANVACDDTNVTTEQAGDKVDYYHDPLVGMAPLTSPRGDKSRHHDVANVACDDTNVTTEQAGDKVDYYHDPLVGMAPLTSPRGDKSRHRDVANVACDDTNVTTSMTRDNVDDFDRSEDLEKLCDMSLDDDIMPLIPDDVACGDEPRMPVSPMEENCLTNILNDTLPITDLDMLDNSGNEIIDKTNGEDDLWGHVRRMDYAVEPETRKFSAKPTKATVRMEKTASEKATELDDCTRRDTSRTGESSKDEETGKTTNQPESSDRRDSAKNEDTKISKHHHVDSNVEIQVANFNVKIHNDTEKLRCGDGGNESIVDGVDAIEIKINLSRGDVVRMINKEGKFNAPVDGDTTERKRRNNASAGLEKIRCRRRRRSMPESFEDFESKRMRRDEDHCSARRLTKQRRNRKIRRSMDDKLLLDEPHSTRENSTSSSAETKHRDFHEISDSRSLSTTIDNERQWEETTKSTRNKINVRLEKLKDSRRLPSPSYNSSVDNSSTLDFDNFDVAPNRDSDEEKSRLADEPRYAREKFRTDGKYESSNNHASRLDDFSSINALERNLNTVPIYTTKDGRITYSPNSNYTYRALIIEARQRAKHSPTVRKAHPRNSYRDATSRKNLFKTSARKVDDKKSRDYPKSRRTSKLRRDFFDDANERPEVRSRKYENRRNASAETANFRNEDRAKEDTSKPRRHDKTTEKCHTEHREPELPVPDPRSISDDRLDAKMADSACLTCDETTISTKSPTKLSIEDRVPVVEKIFQGHEFEISRTPKSPIADKIESPDATLRFFRDNLAAPRPTIMASPSTRLVEKRPQLWDLECQTALSDSGLESSTTYVEARKESRKLQKWKNSFVDRVESAKSIFSVSQDGKDETRYVASEIVHARQNPEAESYRTLEKDEAAEAMNIAEPALPAENIPENFHARIDDSEIVERLDLAVPPCDLDEAKTRCRKKKERDKRAARIFNESSVLSFRRCVSNDGGEFAGLSFEIPKSSDRRDCEESITTTIEENKVSEEIPIDENFSRSCTDSTMDCASFSTSAKLPESASSTRITTPQLEDTSTRFASESMDFSDVYGRANDENSALSSRGTYFLSRLDENALDPSIDCSRRSSDSEHSKDSRKAPILSFSGQIQSDSSLINESKSPPDLTHENECAVTATNETVEKSIDEQPDSSVLDEKVRRNASHPKIPKMIIRNIRSRPGTPNTVEDIEKLEDTSPKVVPDVENKPATTETKMPATTETKMPATTETKMPATTETKMPATTETKIPKMKIKLDDHLPRMIVDTSKSSRPDDKKIRSKKVSKSSNSRSPSANEKLPLVGKLSRQSPEKEARDSHENTENSSGSYKFTLVNKSTSRGHHRRNRSGSREKSSSRNHHHHHRNRSRSREKLSEEAKKEKIPKLTIKKQSQSSNTAKKPRSESPGEVGSKKRKGSAKPLTKKEESRGDEKRRASLESNESNNDSSLAEKVPKVIIKRTSPSAEFKCELSKSDRDAIIKDSKWQPEVKLRRFWVLDCMAKEPGNGQVALKVLESTLNQGDKETISESAPRKNRWNRSSSDALDIREKTYEGKMRRRSDCDLGESSLPTCNNRRKSFESENIEFTDHAKNEHFSFTTRTARSDKLGDKSTEQTGGKGSLKKSHENPDENNSVIKLDSSDESQTTIELLPASLENSQLDTNNQYFTANGDMGKLYSEDAIPTQFELELEIVDNSVDSLDVAGCSIRENYEEEGAATDLGCEKYARPDRKKASEENGAESIVDTRNVCCSDSLVKEVLAAKETLKRCLMTKSKSLVARRTKPRPKTAAEKKQGSCDYVVSENSANDRRTENGQIRGFQGNREESSRDKLPGPREDRICPVLPFASAEARKETREEKTPKRFSETSRGRARSSEVSSVVAKSLKRSGSSTSRDATNKTNKLEDKSIGENSRTKGIASVRKKSANSVENKTEKEETTTSRKTEPCDEVDNNVKSYKIPKISRSKEPNGGNCSASSTSTNNGTTVAGNDDKRKSPSPAKMPILEPQVDLNFELARQRDSDRDTSRSPPVITKQEESLITVLTPKKLEDNADTEKLAGIEKQRDNEAVTFADIVSQLAYHEKATIRHRRYCTLCERWFPTAARHRRHLTGYQHRHTELTQRRTVHALFMLFTGKPCPRLLPASIVRTDCLPGEPTPLQIAVQDVAISLEDSAHAKPSKDATDKDE